MAGRYHRHQVSQYRGRFFRCLGKALNGGGKPVSKKFLLGHRLSHRRGGHRLLERLWDEVVEEHEKAVRWLKDVGGRFGDTNLITGRVDCGRLRIIQTGPVWRDESLTIAEAIRRGQSSLRAA